MKTLFFDVETSGTDDKKNGILQLAGMIEIGERKGAVFDFKMKPFADQIIEDGALKVNEFTRDEIKNFKDPVECYNTFLEIIGSYVSRFDKKDKYTLVGYNSRFDDGFLREWFKQCGADKYTYGSHFHWPAIDVSNMVAVKYRKFRSMFSDFKLMTVAKILKIDVDESRAHDAMYDIAITKAIYEKCIAC